MSWHEASMAPAPVTFYASAQIVKLCFSRKSEESDSLNLADSIVFAIFSAGVKCLNKLTKLNPREGL